MTIKKKYLYQNPQNIQRNKITRSHTFNQTRSPTPLATLRKGWPPVYLSRGNLPSSCEPSRVGCEGLRGLPALIIIVGWVHTPFRDRGGGAGGPGGDGAEGSRGVDVGGERHGAGGLWWGKARWGWEGEEIREASKDKRL